MNGLLLDRRWWGGALLACLVAALAALALPVRLPEGADGTDSSSIPSGNAAETAPEDLGAFLASRRWKASLEQILAQEAAQSDLEAGQMQPSVHPALANMGFVGLIVTGDRSAVLLKSPEGGVDRFVPGDTLPDGRTLVSVTGDSLTLGGDDVPDEVLTLFPRIWSQPPPVDSVDDSMGGAGDAAGDFVSADEAEGGAGVIPAGSIRPRDEGSAPARGRGDADAGRDESGRGR